MVRRTVLTSILLLIAISILATVMLPVSPKLRLLKSVSVPNLQYDSRTHRPIYRHLETARAPVKTFFASMQFTSYSTKGYTDLFQTAPVNTGARLELTGRTIGMVVAADNAIGFDPYTLTTTYDPAKSHLITISIDSSKHVTIWLDYAEVIDTQSPDLDFAISDVMVGRGFSPERAFQGKIANFTYAYGLYEPNPPPVTLSWIRLALISAGIIILFLLILPGDFRLSSVLPGVGGDTAPE